jgi:glycosyltransferase involved in cell wall biosynthesis
MTRILHLNKFLFRFGGADAYMFDLAALQSEAGHDVGFYGMTHPENIDLPDSDLFAPYLELDPAPSGLGAKLMTVGSMMWNRRAMAGLTTYLERFQPDVVHAHNVYHHLSPAIFRVVKAAGLPLVMTAHDYKLVCPSYHLLDKGEVCDDCVGGKFHRALVRRCKDGSLTNSALLAAELALHTWMKSYGAVHRFLCPSRFLMGQLEAGGIWPDRLRHVPNFAEVETTKPVTGARPRRVLYVGRLSHEKAPDMVVRAAGLLAPDIEVTIIGDGPERLELEQLAADVAPGRVKFTGRVSKSEVADAMSQTGVVVVPSRCHENMPLTILEAFAAAVPVVGSSLGGIPELISDGVNGRIVPPNDETATAVAIEQVLADGKKAAMMGEAGRRRVEQHHTAGAHLSRIGELYEEAAAVAQQRGKPSL